MDMPPVTVTALYHYPIKSCAGIALDVATVEPRGIRHDRELMIVEAATGLFFTQRELPRMALIRPRLSDGALRLDAPGMASLCAEVRESGRTSDVVVWRDTCPAVDQGDEAARWLSEFLASDVRLVRMADGYVRGVDPVYATDGGDQVGFADGYPFLIVSEESLADLNGRMAAPLAMNRFRPNIVVRGGGPYAEDGWRQLRVGPLTFDLVKACARCTITTTDQSTAERGKEPLTTLATYRRVERGVLFGQNAIHHGDGAIHVGDSVDVLDRNPAA